MAHKIWTWILKIVLAPVLVAELLTYYAICLPLGIILGVRAFWMGENYTDEEERNDASVFEFVSEDFRWTYSAYETFSKLI